MAEDGVGKLMSLGGHEAWWIAKYFSYPRVLAGLTCP